MGSVNGLVIGLMTLVGRYLTGAPLDGHRRTDATFFVRGTREVARMPSWWAVRVTRWSYLPGWQRAAVRWALLALVYGWWRYPRQTLAVLAVVALGVVALVAAALWRAGQRWRVRRHERNVVQPLYVALAGMLDLPPEVSPGKWLRVPVDYRSNPDALVELALPAHFEAAVRQQTAINALIAARLGGEWDAHWRTAEYRVFWTRPPQAPRKVAYEPSLDEFAPIVGRSKRNEPVTIDMGSDAPHGLVAAGTGAGKSSTLRIFIAHALLHGWLVDIIDPKRRSHLAAFGGVPGVRIHTDIASMILAAEDYYLSMDGANAAVEAGRMNERHLPRRLLVIDEMTSFMDYARNHYRRQGGKGDLPFALQFQYLALQGRQAEHRMVVAPHQPDAKVFGGTSVRGSFGFRLVSGAMTRTLWMTAFGYQKEVKYNSRIKGRGLIGYGESEPRELQIAWLSEEEARAIGLAAPAPPAWFTEGKLPPWVTMEIIEQAETTAGVGWLSPPGQRLSLPAQTAPDVTGHVPPAGLEIVPDLPEPVSHSVTTERPERPRLHVVKPDEEPLIVGIAAAAKYLGYDKPESFRRARSRAKADGEEIPGETRTEDGRPAWRPAGLRSWHSKRQLAGGRPIPGESTGTEKT